ncbi:MAG TPA: cytochrome C oxidase subunit IV family protein [Candidatus Eisenbacteria bacterium]|jgi:caa(3)-type oxidase subunit IV|nr:cytochrome C oxidase subunit IV family protein [Candidatus Eisenbacteria bacterium]
MTHTIPAPERRHPNYVAIWGVLMGALILSLLLAYLRHAQLAALLIWLVAIVKASLVISFYMHLKFEPAHVVAIVIAGVLALAILFLGLFPDIVRVYGG